MQNFDKMAHYVVTRFVLLGVRNVLGGGGGAKKEKIQIHIETNSN